MYDVLHLPAVTFPQGFLWGSATAAHQIEGDNIHSQLWPLEQAGKFPQASGKACNSYVLYKEDIALLQQLGHQAYRFSVEWSRIEPSEGNFDEAAIEHYVDMARRLKDAGITTLVTLHHFTHPLWFEERGGFINLENLPYFERYIRTVVPRIAPYVDMWTLICELNQGISPEKVVYKRAMLRYHARGYRILKELSAAPVSSAHAFPHYVPMRANDPFDQLMAKQRDWMDNEFFFHAIRTGEILLPFSDASYDEELKGSCDYWAVNYYTRHMTDGRRADIEGKRFAHKRLQMIPMDFYLEEMFPEGLIANLERLKDKPVYITENGVACNDDRLRIAYLALHLSALAEAMERGVDVRGYVHWSLLDNYEWGSFVPRFGLVSVDLTTFARMPKPSADYYREIIVHNGVSPELTRKYLKELPTLSDQ